MNRFLTVIGRSMLAFGLLLMYGCMSVEYVGQSFPELSESEPVRIYWPNSSIPDDTYQVIGRVLIEAPDGTTQGDVGEKLIALARQHGAEAVNILEYKRIKIGQVETGVTQPLRVGWNRDDRNAGGAYIYSNYFGQTYAVGGDYTSVTELRIKAVLLVSEKKFKKMQTLSKKELPKAGETDNSTVKNGQTTEEALNKSVKTLEVSPLKPFKADPEPERQPSNIELSADHRPAVSL